MSTAAERLAALDSLPGADLCRIAADTLAALVRVTNEETTLLRAGRHREATPVTTEKTRLAQEYVGCSRAIQRELDGLRIGHERLAVQLAENLRVIATARAVTDDILSDVAQMVGARDRTRTYGSNGAIADPAVAARGVAINRAL
jgi:hypothetical protein